ncbi:MAG TPA: 50S ribosomal protein L32 [Candidatus Paceibacterota bacterium]
MGGVPVKRHSKSKVGRRRSHLARKPVNLSVCSNCGSPVLPHRACSNCGSYKTLNVKK